jgi:ribonuclease PH
MHTHSPSKLKKFEQTLSAHQKADGSCLIEQESSADGGIHVTRDQNNITSVL